MKKNALLALALLFIAYSFGQDCELETDIVDEFTGKIEKSTRLVQVDDKVGYNLKFSLTRLGDRIFLYVHRAQGFGCVTGNSYVAIKLENAEIVKMYHSSNIDCDEYASIWAVIDEEAVSKLMASPMVKIRAWGSERGGDHDVVLKNYFIDQLPCLE